MFVTNTRAQDERVMAIYLYHFANNTQWPSASQKGPFVIAIIGDSRMAYELKSIAKTKKIGQQILHVEAISSPKDIPDKCHMIYIAPGRSKYFSEIIAQTKYKPVLIVTDKPGLAQNGAGINFVHDGDKINIEINQKSLKQRHLTIKASLLRIAKLVE